MNKPLQNFLKKFFEDLKSGAQTLWGKARENKKYILWGILAVFVLHLIFVVGLVVAINRGMFGPMPGENQLKSIENPTAAVIYTADSVMMGKYYLQNRMDLKNGEVTPTIINALIATEDVRFYEHNGIDVRSLFRVLIKTILLRQESSGGGSTITQQLAKNLYPRRKYPFASIVINKLREMVIAPNLKKYIPKNKYCFFT